MNVTLPESLKEIGAYAFGVNKLASVTFPKSITTYGKNILYENKINEVKFLGAATLKKDSLKLSMLQYEFDGWYTDFASTKKWDSKVTGPLKLYAKWKRDSSPRDIGNHWARESIEQFVAQGIITGYADGTFRPNEPLKRKHAASILAKVFDLPATVPLQSFSDVQKSHSNYAAIAKLQQAGVISGSNGKFRPDETLTRAQMAKILVLASDFPLGGNSTFPDVKATDWSSEYIASLADLQVVSGSNGLYMPNKAVTRGQFVSMLDKALKVNN